MAVLVDGGEGVGVEGLELGWNGDGLVGGVVVDVIDREMDLGASFEGIRITEGNVDVVHVGLEVVKESV